MTRIITHQCGLIGWLFGDTDKHEDILESSIINKEYPDGMCCSAAIGIRVSATTVDGRVIEGFEPIDE